MPPTRLHKLVVTLAGVAAAAHFAAAQSTPVTVRGIAFDSLRNRPLSGAVVSLVPSRKTVISDAGGAFVFDSIAPGRYALLLQHDAVDSLGLERVTSAIEVTDGARPIVAAIPGFGSFWRVSCTTPPPSDSLLIIGSVRDASKGTGLVGATVYLRWTTIVKDKRGKLGPATIGGEVKTTKDGRYAACGVPADLPVRVSAIGAGTAAASDLGFSDARVRRFDLTVPAMGDTALRGVVTGVVRDAAGEPFVHARVMIPGVREVQTGDDGGFVLPAVPLGTREMLVTAVGADPRMVRVDVSPRDTASVTLALGRVTNLNTVRVSAAGVRQIFLNDLAARQTQHFAKFTDSSIITRTGTLNGALLTTTNIKVSKNTFYFPAPNRSGVCIPVVFIDGRQSDQEELRAYPIDEIGTIETYSTGTGVPTELWPRSGLSTCTIAMWTKRKFP